MKLGAKIGEGAFRECFEVEGWPDLCAKVQTPYKLLKVPRSSALMEVRTSVYVLMRTGFLDANFWELDALGQMPDSLREYVPEYFGWSRVDRDRSALYVERPMNFDGSFSERIKDHGPVEDPGFWEEIEFIVAEIRAAGSKAADVLNPKGHNLLVQRTSEHGARPVLIDVKHFGQKLLALREIWRNRERYINQNFEEHVARFRERFDAKARLG